MDKIKLLIDIFVLIMIANEVNCNSQCDCNSIMDVQEFIKRKLDKIELDNFKIKKKLKRIQSSKRRSTQTNDDIVRGDSNRQPTNDDKKEKNRDQVRIDLMESKLAGIESLLKIDDVNVTDVQKGIMQSRVLDELGAKLLTVSQEVNDTIKNNHANKAVLGNLVKKTLLSEKRIRMKFEASLKNSLEDVKTSFIKFRTESLKMIANHSDTIDRILQQSTEKVNEVSENINKLINEELNTTNVSLNDLTEELTDTKTGLSSLREVTINNKIDGGWSSWENWGSCSESCGGGLQSRIRKCSNPRPSLPGNFCDGNPLQIKICNKHQCKEFNVAFTAYFLHSNSTSYSTIVFQSTYINNGDAYDTTTGKFTCKIPGVYYFSVTITKQYMELSYVFAYLRINDVYILGMFWKPYGHDDKHQYEQTPLTQSGTFHLNKNDVVDIYGIPNYFHNSFYSTFTGYLITPD